MKVYREEKEKKWRKNKNKWEEKRNKEKVKREDKMIIGVEDTEIDRSIDR